MRTNLIVPFEEKYQARLRGARWDAARKVWYVPDGLDLSDFIRWRSDVEITPEVAAVLSSATGRVKSSKNRRGGGSAHNERKHEENANHHH